MKYGIQMYSVRDVAQKDLKAALKTVAEIGYNSVEFAGFFGNDAETVRSWLEEYGLEVIAADIQNTDNNCTRFIVISREAVLPEDAEKISLCFSLPHTPGSLCHTLERFALLGLNLTKIESRPIPERNFEYDFYLDFTGNVHDVQTLALICALSDEMPRFSFLGNYKER